MLLISLEGEIFYECLGGDQYRITLKVYRDCLNGEAPFDNPATISVYNSAGGHVTDLFAPFFGIGRVRGCNNKPLSSGTAQRVR